MTDVIVAVSQPLDRAAAEKVKNRLQAIEGVRDVAVGARAARLLQCHYDPDTVPAQALLDAVRSLGYQGRLVAI